MPFPACWTLTSARMPDYIAQIRDLAQTYRGEIDVYCGEEWDLHGATPPSKVDYVIGSVHHVKMDDALYCVDNTVEETERTLAYCFDGDADAMAEVYFRQYDAIASINEVDLVGHFDLLTKFDEQRSFFHPDSPRYQKSAERAMDALIAAGKRFEINTGAISRGYRTTPYPSRTLLTQICSRGGKIVISSDAHRAEDIAFGFSEAEALAYACGFREILQFNGEEFVPEPLSGR